MIRKISIKDFTLALSVLEMSCSRTEQLSHSKQLLNDTHLLSLVVHEPLDPSHSVSLQLSQDTKTNTTMQDQNHDSSYQDQDED